MLKFLIGDFLFNLEDFSEVVLSIDVAEVTGIFSE